MVVTVMETMEIPFSVRLRRAIADRLGPAHEGQFADRIGMNRTQLSKNLKNLSYRPEPETIRRYADGLGLDAVEVASWIPGYILPESEGAETIALAPRNDEDGLAEALAKIEAMTDDEVIRFAEGLPGEYHRRFMAEEKRLRSHPSYVRFCRGMLGAFASNRNAALKAARSARE